MKRRCNVHIILIVFLLLIQQIIYGCTATVSKKLYEKDLYREEVDLIGQNLFRDKCSLCHELPVIDAYPYTSEQWASIINYMHDTKEAGKFITTEETEKIKGYLKNMSQTR
jgi:hypothetical protein